MTQRARRWWPGPRERELVGRAYGVELIAEALNVVFPFQFAYFLLVMSRPEWAALPLLCGGVTALIFEVPSGVVADRVGRKVSVVSGYVLMGAGWAAVPWAVSAPGSAQVWATSACFVVGGVGQTLVSGAMEAWVVDNLRARGRSDLVAVFFVRSASFSAMGGVVAGLVALGVLLWIPIQRAVLDGLWWAAAGGLWLAAIGLMGMSERTVDADRAADGGQAQRRLGAALRVIWRRPALLALSAAVAVATFAGAPADEALNVTLIIKGMDVRLLAPLGVAADLVGVLAPLWAPALSRRFGAEAVLIGVVLASGATAFIFLFEPAWPVVCGVFLVLASLDRVWDPLAEATMHQWIPSNHRATVVSVINQGYGLAEIAGFGTLAWLMGSYSDTLGEVVPDLVEAFQGRSWEVEGLPRVWLDMPLSDFMSAFFIGVWLLSVPFLVCAYRAGRRA